MREKEQREIQCAECEKKIEYGRDVVTVEKGVVGPRGIVPLGEMMTFCSEDCVGRYFDGTPSDDLPKLPPRIP